MKIIAAPVLSLSFSKLQGRQYNQLPLSDRLGTCVHAVARDYILHLNAVKRFSDMTELQKIQDKAMARLRIRDRDFVNVCIRNLCARLREKVIKPSHVMGVETMLSAWPRIQGVEIRLHLTAKVDLLEDVTDVQGRAAEMRTLKILDYKTRPLREADSEQMDFYAYVAAHHFPGLFKFVQFVLDDLHDNQILSTPPVRLDADLRRRVETTIRNHILKPSPLPVGSMPADGRDMEL